MAEEARLFGDDLDAAVRDLVSRLDTNDPAEAKHRGEDGETVAFNAEALHEAARRGHPRAQYWMAQCLLSAESTITDPDEGVRWLHLAAMNGHGNAANHLGALYQDGKVPLVVAEMYESSTFSPGERPGYVRDLDLAAKYLGVGARTTESPPACWRLGQLYVQRAIRRNDANAGERGIFWTERAAHQGVNQACLALARFFLCGADGGPPVPGVQPNYERSQEWGRKVPGAEDLVAFAARLALVSPVGSEPTGRRRRKRKQKKKTTTTTVQAPATTDQSTTAPREDVSETATTEQSAATTSPAALLLEQQEPRDVGLDSATRVEAKAGARRDGQSEIKRHDDLATAAAKADAVGTTRQRAGRDYDHDEVCLICWDGGYLVCCDFCPASYHPECLLKYGWTSPIDPPGVSSSATKASSKSKKAAAPPKPTTNTIDEETWECPHHSCVQCNRKSATAGGLLFRCMVCPNSYCEDHLPADARMMGRCERFEALGQRHPQEASFLLCSPDCVTWAKTTGDFVDDAEADGTEQSTATNPPAVSEQPPDVGLDSATEQALEQDVASEMPPEQKAALEPPDAVGGVTEQALEHQPQDDGADLVDEVSTVRLSLVVCGADDIPATLVSTGNMLSAAWGIPWSNLSSIFDCEDDDAFDDYDSDDGGDNGGEITEVKMEMGDVKNQIAQVRAALAGRPEDAGEWKRFARKKKKQDFLQQHLLALENQLDGLQKKEFLLLRHREEATRSLV